MKRKIIYVTVIAIVLVFIILFVKNSQKTNTTTGANLRGSDNKTGKETDNETDNKTVNETGKETVNETVKTDNESVKETVNKTGNETGKETKLSGSTKKVLMVSYSNIERDWTHLIKESQEKFCTTMNYDYTYYNKLPDECERYKPDYKQVQPQWHKIYLLKALLTQNLEYEYIVWIDDDISCLTDNNWIQKVIEQGDNDTKLWVAMDILGNLKIKKNDNQNCLNGPIYLNTGIMIVKNDDNTIINDILKFAYNNCKSLFYCQNQSCLHEQRSLENVIIHNYTMRTSSNFRVIYETNKKSICILTPVFGKDPGQNWNTVHRISHYDEKRQMYLDYDRDPSKYKYEDGYNTAHFTGMESSVRWNEIQKKMQAY